MNLQSKFGYCITTQTLNIALYMLVGWNYGRTDRQKGRQSANLAGQGMESVFVLPPIKFISIKKTDYAPDGNKVQIYLSTVNGA